MLTQPYTFAPGLCLVPKRPPSPRPASATRSTRVSGSFASLWRRMMTVAYNASHLSFDAGCVVDALWHDYDAFCSSVVLLPGYDASDSSLLLSRIYYGSNCYSPLCSAWVTRSDNQIYDRATTYPCVDGIVFLSNSDVISSLGVSVAHLRGRSGVVAHSNSKLKGHVVSEYVPPDGMLLRRRF